LVMSSSLKDLDLCDLMQRKKSAIHFGLRMHNGNGIL